jgi:hypothetical protein
MGDINHMGFQASGQGVQTMSDMLKNQAQLAYADSMNKANAKSSSGGGSGIFGKVLGGLGSLVGGLALL